MPFDGNIQDYTKADPFHIDTFIGWLETMPPEGVYDYYPVDGTCLVGQYGAAVYGAGDRRWHDLHRVKNTPFCGIAQRRPRTFGAALDRARAMRGDG